MKRKSIALLQLMTLLFLSGCAAVPYYVDAGYSDVIAGDSIKVRLVDGSHQDFVVSDVDDETIRGEGGEAIQRQDIDEISVRIASGDIPCSSWASWRNIDCWAN
ncbi:MAG: hypothetical protein QNI99_08890 [Woeseiaceae bacterium]|nr:hypothetical protein [Woeseiaceae bacterium]